MARMMGARKPKADRLALLRAAPGTNTPLPYKKPARVKGAAPEAILQAEVNEALDAMGLYYFRLSERLLAKGGDKSAGGWPDNPIIIPVIPGMSLLFPLELKRKGEDLRPNQVEMQERIGTVMKDDFDGAYGYILWARTMAEKIKKIMAINL